MNKIVIQNNYLEEYEDDSLTVFSQRIIFKKSGDYVLEYEKCNDIQLEIVVLDQVMVKLFISSIENELVAQHHYILGTESQLLLFQFYCNHSVREKTIVDLNGKKSLFSQGFSSISRGCEEYHIIVNHNQQDVVSDIRNKCIGLDGGKIRIQIDSNLEKGNANCVMDQTSRILTLGDVEAEIIPNMFIEDDQVTARHGSVIGGFQDDEIFYLMSRGISYEEAEMLLIKGFIFSNLIVDLEKRAMIFSCIQNLRRSRDES